MTEGKQTEPEKDRRSWEQEKSERATLISSRERHGGDETRMWTLNRRRLQRNTWAFLFSVEAFCGGSLLVPIFTKVANSTSAHTSSAGPLGDNALLAVSAVIILSFPVLVLNFLCLWRSSIPDAVIAEPEGVRLLGSAYDKLLQWDELAAWHRTRVAAPLIMLQIKPPPSILINLSGYSRKDIREMKKVVMERIAACRR